MRSHGGCFSVLGLFHGTQCLRVPPPTCSQMTESFLSKAEWHSSHCLPWILHLSISWWAWRLIPLLGSCRLCCDGHGRADVSGRALKQRVCILSVYHYPSAPQKAIMLKCAPFTDQRMGTNFSLTAFWLCNSGLAEVTWIFYPQCHKLL